MHHISYSFLRVGRWTIKIPIVPINFEKLFIRESLFTFSQNSADVTLI